MNTVALHGTMLHGAKKIYVCAVQILNNFMLLIAFFQIVCTIIVRPCKYSALTSHFFCVIIITTPKHWWKIWHTHTHYDSFMPAVSCFSEQCIQVQSEIHRTWKKMCIANKLQPRIHALNTAVSRSAKPRDATTQRASERTSERV